MDLLGTVVPVVIAAVLLLLRDIIAAGVRRGILDAHGILESEKSDRSKHQVAINAIRGLQLSSLVAARIDELVGHKPCRST